MELYLIVFPESLVQGTMVSCAFYAVILSIFLFLQKYIARKKILTKKDEALLLTLVLWLFLAPSCLYVAIYIFNIFIPLLSIYLLVFFIMTVPLRVVGDLLAGKMGLFVISMASCLLLLCTYNLMPECVYNILVLYQVFPHTSPWLGILSYGTPIIWIVLEMFGELGLKRLWRRSRHQYTTPQE